MRLRLAIRYTLISSCILLIVMTISSYLHVNKVEKIFEETSRHEADTIAEMILTNSYHLMLEDNRHHLQLMIEEIGDNPRVESARILGREGVIGFSTEVDEINTLLHEEDESCAFCHQPGSRVMYNVPVADRTRIFTGDDGREYLGVTRGIYNEPNCYTAACHVHPPEEKKVGVLDLVFARDQMANLSYIHNSDVFVSTTFMLVILSLCHYLITRKYICKPIELLLSQTQALAGGDLSARVTHLTNDEVGELGHSFNHMAENLQSAQVQLKEWGDTLELKVEQRTAEMKSMQNQLLQSAKLASMGELVAGIAHEINNPLTGILMFASLSAKNPDLPPQVKDNLALIVAESERCAKIVRGLLEFARESIPEKKSASFNQIIENTLNLVTHQPLFQDIDVRRHLAENLPEVELDVDQWQQVFLNMFINAGQAMPDSGSLVLTTEHLVEKNWIRVIVEDTGTGIDPEHLDKVFDPFFSTKEETGFGLGLSVTYGIIKNHGGTVDVRSTPGEGTTFIIEVPVVAAAERAEKQGRKMT